MTNPCARCGRGLMTALPTAYVSALSCSIVGHFPAITALDTSMQLLPPLNWLCTLEPKVEMALWSTVACRRAAL